MYILEDDNPEMYEQHIIDATRENIRVGVTKLKPFVEYEVAVSSVSSIGASTPVKTRANTYLPGT